MSDERLPRGAPREAAHGPNAEPHPLAEPGDAAESLLLARVVAVTSHLTGEEYLGALPEALAAALGVRHVLLSRRETANDGRFLARATWSSGLTRRELSWPAADETGAAVLAGRVAHDGQRVRGVVPDTDILRELGTDGYVAVPLLRADGTVRGHLVLLHDTPLDAPPARIRLLEILAARAVGELERIDVERRLRESEETFRGLFEEAPIAYVYEETSTRFVSANRAAQDLLGVKPDEVTSTYGITLVAPAPDVQERVHASLEAEQAGASAARSRSSCAARTTDVPCTCSAGRGPSATAATRAR